MGQVLFHKRIQEEVNVRRFQHVTRATDFNTLISQGWELVHIEHDSECNWNHYMLIWTKKEDPPEFKTEYQRETEEREAKKEADQKQLEREKLLVEMLVRLIPEKPKLSEEFKLLTAQGIKKLEEEAQYADDKELYPHALGLLQSRLALKR